MELVIQYALKGILVLLEEERSYARNTNKFYNSKIENNLKDFYNDRLTKKFLRFADLSSFQSCR